MAGKGLVSPEKSNVKSHRISRWAVVSKSFCSRQVFKAVFLAVSLCLGLHCRLWPTKTLPDLTATPPHTPLVPDALHYLLLLCRQPLLHVCRALHLRAAQKTLLSPLGIRQSFRSHLLQKASLPSPSSVSGTGYLLHRVAQEGEIKRRKAEVTCPGDTTCQGPWGPSPAFCLLQMETLKPREVKLAPYTINQIGIFSNVSGPRNSRQKTG